MRENLKKLSAFFHDWDKQSGYLRWMITNTKPFMRPLILIFVLNLIISFVGIASAVITKYVIDGVTGSSKNFTVTGIALLLGLTSVSIAVSAYSGIITTYINEKYAFSIREKVYGNILRGVWRKITSFHSGDTITRLTSDINSVAGGISSIIPNILFLIVKLIMAFCILYYYDHFLALASIIIGPIGVLLSMFYSGKLKKCQVELNKVESEYRSFLQETIGNVAVIKAFEQEPACNKTMSQFRVKRLDIVMRRNKLNTAMLLCIRSVFSISYLIAFCWGIYRLATGSITYGTMSVFLSLVSQIQEPIVNLGTTIPQFITVLASAGRVIEIDGIEPEKQEAKIIPDSSKKVGLRIRNVSFGYGRETVLKDINLNIRPNDIVGIVGYSGIGKTTLAFLILSLLQAESGDITFYDDSGLEEKASATARRFISYVPQGNTLLSGTIADNLRRGKPDATEDEIWEALKTAGCMPFLSGLDDGINTCIGENGLGLSQGQAQRIAIARAIIKSAPILILDEATSALDSKTEEQVIQNMRGSDLIHTCFIITHRRSMLVHCTRALEIDSGHLIEFTPDQAYFVR